MSFQPLSFDADTYLSDVRMFGQPAFGAVYLIDDERKAIIETG
ncbi:MAG: MBL fold metallo-hydrolase, partial [Methanobacteriota archaeon]